MGMVWKLLRPQYWILNRKIRKVNRLIIVTLILVLGLGGAWIYNNLIQGKLSFLNSEQGVVAIAAYLPLTLIFFLAFALLGIGDILHQLYMTSEVELMLIMPVPSRTIFLVKVLGCSRASFVPALGLGALLFLSGSVRNAPLSYYLLVIFLMLVAVTLTTTLIMILVVLMTRWLPIKKTQSWIPVAVALMTFVLMLVQQPITEWLLGQTAIISFLANALLDTGRLALIAVGSSILTLVTSEVAYRIFDKAFHEGWNRLREVPIRKGSISSAARGQRGISRWLQPLSAPLRSLIVKEWLELRRDPRSIITLIQPLVLMAVIVLVPALGKGSLAEPLLPLFFWLMLLMLTIYLGILPVGTFQMSIAREGHRIALLRSAPISMSNMLKGKLWATWTPMILSWVLILLASGILLQFPLWQTGFLLGITIYGLSAASVASVASGGLCIRFNVDELKQRISTPVSYLLMVVNLIYMVSIATICVWFMIRLFPDSRVILSIQSLAAFNLIGWIFSDQLWIPVLLGSTQVIFWIGSKILWDAAVRRLEKWE